MLHRRLVYIYLLNVPSFSSRYFNKIKRTSRLGRLLALSLEILGEKHSLYFSLIRGPKKPVNARSCLDCFHRDKCKMRIIYGKCYDSSHSIQHFLCNNTGYSALR